MKNKFISLITDIISGSLIISENRICQVCGKPAIGIQILGCCQSVVCEDHAEKILIQMARGEKKEYGACYYWRL